jgi:predicted GNAT family N-acyltransferase
MRYNKQTRAQAEQQQRGKQASWGAVYTIRLACGDDFDAIFQARHRVYVTVDGSLQSSPDGRICDRYDQLATTRHIVADVAGRIVGGIRLTTWSNDGLPAFDYFDFRPFLPAAMEKVANGSLIFVDRPFRKSGVGQSLMMHWYAELLKLRCTHAIGVLNPPLIPWLVGHGFRAVSSALKDQQTGVPFVPIILELAQLQPEIAMAARQLGNLRPNKRL